MRVAGQRGAEECQRDENNGERAHDTPPQKWKARMTGDDSQNSPSVAIQDLSIISGAWNRRQGESIRI
ncbi:hypothetical protein Acsp05_20390 [Actinokineospora sp. NBRC 105648]|nr:hypothetical protein Acsp05_20390 [Actinokineospora sp. NBRC 105648]